VVSDGFAGRLYAPKTGVRAADASRQDAQSFDIAQANGRLSISRSHGVAVVKAGRAEVDAARGRRPHFARQVPERH